jgi:hypothetical protein
MSKKADFAKYLLTFYGPDGVYGPSNSNPIFRRPMTREEAAIAAETLSASKDFEGDSFDREKARDLVLSWRGEHKQSAFEKAKSEIALIEQELADAVKILKSFPVNAMGLPSESDRLSPKYRTAKVRADKAFAKLRALNTVFVKRFAKEMKAERDKRYGR